MEEKLKTLCNLITKETQDRLYRGFPTSPPGFWDKEVAIYKPKKKYTNIDIGGSGKYMVVNETGEIYGIKAYGVIHRGHFFGTLDTINNYYWGDYTAIKKG